MHMNKNHIEALLFLNSSSSIWKQVYELCDWLKQYDVSNIIKSQ